MSFDIHNEVKLENSNSKILRNVQMLEVKHFFVLLFVFCLFRATSAAYGVSQARGLIGAVATGYTRATVMWDLSHICDLHHSSQQCQILNPLSKARDPTHILMDTSKIHFCCTTMGTPRISNFKDNTVKNFKL